MDTQRETPDLPQAVAALLLSMLVLLAVSLLISLLLWAWGSPASATGGSPALPDPEDPRIQALGLPIQHGALALTAIALARASTDGARRALALGPARCWPAVLLIVPVGHLADRAVELARSLLPELGTLSTLATAVRQPGLTGAAVIAGAVLAAPVAEELLFRGYIYRGLERRLGPAAAVLASAAAFGAFHLDPVHAIGASIIGLWLGWLRRITGSIRPCIAAHIANNLIWLIAARAGWEPDLPPLLDLAAALAVAAGVALSARRAR